MKNATCNVYKCLNEIICFDLLLGDLQHIPNDSLFFNRSFYFKVDPEKPVLVSGDWEREQMKNADKNGGLSYSPKQHEVNARLAQELGVKPMMSKSKSCSGKCFGK